MRAMILAAGRGERMGALTQHTPKPLLEVNGKYLIEYAIENLVRAGIFEIAINLSYHSEQIKSVLGDGKRYDISIFYSEEEERLETGGGIFKALPFFEKDPFLVLSSDIITDYPLSQLPPSPKGLAHLVLVNNPPYHPRGDFGLANGLLSLAAQPSFTFSNIGVYRPELFAACEAGHFPLSQLLLPAIAAGQLTGEYYSGLWFNVGTAKDLVLVNESMLLPLQVT